jgi:hypothetical protein
VKRQLSGCFFDHADDLLTAVQEVLDGFDKSTSISVFEEFVRRLEQCIETEESTLDNLKSTSGFIRFALVNIEMLIGAWDTSYNGRVPLQASSILNGISIREL